MSDLHATLDAPLPPEVATGAGTAIFVCGWCYSPAARIRTLDFVLDGSVQPVLAQRMPRLDPLNASGDPRAYRSGFWGIVAIAAGTEVSRDLTLELHAELNDGSKTSATLGHIRVARALESPNRPAIQLSQGAAGPRVAVCLATHNPPADLLATQLESIRRQTHGNWVCCISDDCSSSASFALLQEAIAGDPRFLIDRSPKRLGFYRNFERAISMAPADAEYVALADQDDRWHPDKLATLVEEIGDAPLIYSDSRIVDRAGKELASTYWTTRHNNHSDLLSLLIANSVTGAASLMRADLLSDALPFPPDQFAHYHDHWLALVALCRGEIRFVERSLYDYVQHGTASLGHARATQMPTLGDRIRGLRTKGPGERIRKWRMHYFVDVARLLQVSTILAMRLNDRMSPEKRRILERFLACDDDVTEMGTLIRRGIRELRGTPETLGAEWMLLFALLWRRLLSATAREQPQSVMRIDALPPTDLAPGTSRGAGAASPARALADKIAPLALTVTVEAPQRINLLIPRIDLDHFFGGYIAKFNLALALAHRGQRVRIVTVDPGVAPARGWVNRIEGYSGLSGFGDRVEVAFGRESAGGLEVSPADRFIATTWWTAHIAHAAAAHLGAARFLYLIQEYEPFTFPMGSYAALANDSYRLPHDALFSTELLRDYFRAHSIGVYAAGPQAGERASATFNNAITTVQPPALVDLEGRRTRRLLFYARPEAHAARNLFELGILALEQAARDGCFRHGWELRGIGSVRGQSRLALGEGLTLNLEQRTDQAGYARRLAEHDVGLALMYTPHPSLVPLEMASAGMLTVTNTFENKTPQALTAISSNLIAAEPTTQSIAAALARAEAAVGDHAARIAGSHVEWPDRWTDAFDEPVLAFVETALR